MGRKKILITGISGMLGHKIFAFLSNYEDFDVYGTARRFEILSECFPNELLKKVRADVDVSKFDSIAKIITDIKPHTVINCIGIIKQQPAANDPLTTITVNAIFPHKLALLCQDAGIRMIHISTDCVFNGSKGNYTEQDPSDADDLYGKTKFLGEVKYPHCVTLRTSIIGHELKTRLGLTDWFLSQKNQVKGFTKAIFSGFPTVELSRIIAAFVLPNQELTGLYHISSDPISKYELLRLIASFYNKQIEIVPENSTITNRSLNSTLFRDITGYVPPTWPNLIEKMAWDYNFTPYYHFSN